MAEIMKTFVLLLLCGVLSQALAAPVKEEQKRQFRRLVKIPQDVENLEKELEAEKQEKKLAKQQESLKISTGDVLEGNDLPPEVNADGSAVNLPVQDPVAALGELSKNDESVMSAVRELLDYLSENPGVLRRRMQKEQQKQLRQLTESLANGDNEMSRYLMDLSPQLSSQPKRVEKKNGYRVPQGLPSGSESESSANEDNAVPVFPGNYIEMQEGGEKEEKEEHAHTDTMNKLAKGIVVAEQKDGEDIDSTVAETGTSGSDSEESSESTSDDDGDDGDDEADKDVDETEEEENKASQTSVLSDEDRDETGSDLAGFSEDEITKMLETELEDIDEAELLTLLLNRHRPNSKH